MHYLFEGANAHFLEVAKQTAGSRIDRNAVRQVDARISRPEATVDDGFLAIAPLLPDIDFAQRCGPVGNAPMQALSGLDADRDFRDVPPAAVLVFLYRLALIASTIAGNVYSTPGRGERGAGPMTHDRAASCQI